MKLMLLMLVLSLSAKVFAQNNKRVLGLNCGLSFSNAHREYMEGLAKGSSVVKSPEDFEVQKLSLVKSIFIDLPLHVTEGRSFETLDLVSIKNSYERAEFKLDSQSGLKDARQSLLEVLLKRQGIEPIDYTRVHFEDAIWTYNGRWLTPYIKRQIIEKLWEELEAQHAADQKHTKLYSLSYIFESKIIDAADLNATMYVELNQIFRHYGFLPRFEF
jgi:hypothetical protein